MREYLIQFKVSADELELYDEVMDYEGEEQRGPFARKLILKAIRRLKRKQDKDDGK